MGLAYTKQIAFAGVRYSIARGKEKGVQGDYA